MKKLNFTINDCVILPPSKLYNDILWQSINNSDYHLYAILSMPIVQFETVNIVKNHLILDYTINDQKSKFIISIDSEYLSNTSFSYEFNVTKTQIKVKWSFSDNEKRKPIEITLYADMLYQRFSNKLEFKIEYIGQSFGQNGGRNSKTRLENHNTLQKILAENAAKFKPNEIYLMLMNTEYIEISNKLELCNGRSLEGSALVCFDDVSSNKSTGKFLNLIEAFLINYFKPEYNRVFVNGIVPCKNHTSYEQVMDDGYEDFSLNIYFNFPQCDLTFKTDTNSILLKDGYLSKNIFVSFDTANHISPEEYYYSFFNYDN